MRQGRRLRQAALVGLTVTAAILLAQWGGLFASAQCRAADYLYDQDGSPGSDIVIVAIDERTLQALGDWPLPFSPYVQLLARLRGARAIGFDVLLPDSGPTGNPDAAALLDAVSQAGNVVVPMAALELRQATRPGELPSADRAVRTFPALLQAAAAGGSVNQVVDRDGTVRRVPLLVNAGGGEVWEAFGLQVLRLWLGLDRSAVASLTQSQVSVGTEAEVMYQVSTDAYGTMLINFVGRPATFPAVSFVDVIDDRVPSSTFDQKIVLVGLINALTEMDLHETPVSPQRMAGIELQANVIHTLLNHRPLVQQSQVGSSGMVVLLALCSALVLSQLEALSGAVCTVLLALGYFGLTSLLFNRGLVPGTLFPYAAILANYAALMAARFASEQGERRRVTDIFGRFVSTGVRDQIVELALRDPSLIRPGGRQVELSVLFADIRGFTTLAENLPPSEVVEILNQYLDSMEEQVFKQSGTLDKYTGDGMMVLFGAPLEQPDHAIRAVRTALGMQRMAAEVSARRSDAQGKVAYGIGITTGSAVVGHIGSQRRLDYTAIGDTVNLAARLESIAPPGTILVNQATCEAVREFALVQELPPVTVKGKARPVPVYKVLGLREDAAEGEPQTPCDGKA